MSTSSKWNVPHRYELGKGVGTGSYGAVYQAWDKVEKKNVAIKKVKRVFEDLIDCKRILREIAILSRTDDDRVVRLYDICVPSDLLNFTEIYLVLELCDSDFKKLFHLREFLTEQHAITLLYNTMCGISYLHSAGVYHRDLKPANCLVNTNCSVKICDFGLSRALGHDEARYVESTAGGGAGLSRKKSDIEQGRLPKRQLTGHVVTRWYRAPELILLQDDYSNQIDVWSMGCIFAELLGMIKENIPYPSNRCPLFQGGSCFPLSPDRKDRDSGNGSKNSTRSGSSSGASKDQLNMIFNVLGTPSEPEVEKLTSDDSRKYVRCFKPRRPVSLLGIDRFRAASRESMDLLQQMLVFDPDKRITVDECLEHPAFDGVRKKSEEKKADKRIVLDFEAEAELDELRLRKYFLLEIKRFHADMEIPYEIRMLK
jgi:mitogen-activated protein kinase 1/3